MAAVGQHTTDVGTRTTRTVSAAGLLAALVFVLTFTVDGWLRPGYDPASMFVSELSRGPGGWVQKANFVVTGLLVLVFAVGLSRTGRRPSAPRPRAERVAVGALAAMGVGLAGSGFADTDPSAMFTQVTAEGLVHGALGAVVFLALPTSCAAVAMTVRDPAERTWRRVTTAVAVALVVGIVVLKLSEQPALGLFAVKGLVQRVELVLYFAWLAVFALRLRRRDRPRSTRRRTR